MAMPRKSRRLCGDIAVVGIFTIRFSQRHYVALRRLAQASATPAFAIAPDVARQSADTIKLDFRNHRPSTRACLRVEQ
jgi:hypothetical protein